MFHLQKRAFARLVGQASRLGDHAVQPRPRTARTTGGDRAIAGHGRQVKGRVGPATPAIPAAGPAGGYERRRRPGPGHRKRRRRRGVPPPVRRSSNPFLAAWSGSAGPAVRNHNRPCSAITTCRRAPPRSGMHSRAAATTSGSSTPDPRPCATARTRCHRLGRSGTGSHPIWVRRAVRRGPVRDRGPGGLASIEIHRRLDRQAHSPTRYRRNNVPSDSIT